MAKRFLRKDLIDICKQNNLKCKGTKAKIYDELFALGLIPITPAPDLPIDVLIEIALQTNDPVTVLNQCKITKEMAKRCNAQFWKTWMRINTPEVFIVINTPENTVYDQLYFTPETLYEKMYYARLIRTKDYIDELLRKKVPLQQFTRQLSTDIEFKVKDAIRDNPVQETLDTTHIVKFRPISDVDEIYIVVEAIERAGTDETSLVGVYKANEIKSVETKYNVEFRTGQFWWIKINMKKFKIGEVTKELPKEIEVKFSFQI